jgi:branched-chain amino acid transport system permease protein
MTELVQCLVRGLGDGSVYALLAFGFVIIYKSMGVISFAQPSLMLAGAVLVTYLVTTMNFYLAVLVAAAAVALLAMGVERTVLRPMIGKPVFVISIITLGVDIVIRVVVNAYIGLDVRPVGAPWGLATSSLLGIEVQQRHLVMFVTTMVLVAVLFAFFRYSRMGLAMRAVAFDQEVALAQGVSVGLVFTLSWAIAGALATVAGVFVSTGAGVDQQLWLIALKALPVIILGGLDSLGGAVIAGLAIGVVESLVATYGPDLAPWLGGEFALVTPYLVMMVVLLVRQGMLAEGAGNYSGSPNEAVFRQSEIHKPDEAAPSGVSVLEPFFTGPSAKKFVFEEACYQ